MYLFVEEDSSKKGLILYAATKTLRCIVYDHRRISLQDCFKDIFIILKNENVFKKVFNSNISNQSFVNTLLFDLVLF